MSILPQILRHAGISGILGDTGPSVLLALKPTSSGPSHRIPMVKAHYPGPRIPKVLALEYPWPKPASPGTGSRIHAVQAVNLTRELEGSTSQGDLGKAVAVLVMYDTT